RELEFIGAWLPESLRLLVVGGSAVSRPHWEAWRAAVGGRVRWLNAYGLTETTITSTTYEPPPCEVAAGSTAEIPIGRPLAHTRAYILDGHLHPVPPGTPGELFLGGEAVAVGYLNRPDLTAERFLPNPFGEGRGERLFRTGDRARFLADGTI